MLRRTPWLVACTVLLLGADAPTVPPVDAPLVVGMSSPKDAAVVVGIERYGFLARVPHAENDAEAFAAFLERTRGIPADRVTTLIGKIDRAQILKALQFAGGSVGAGGTVWVYFAGHGAAHPDTKQRLLLPVETTSNVDAFKSVGIAVDEVERLATSGGGQVLLVADACYTGVGRDGAELTGGRLAVPESVKPPARGALWFAVGADEMAGPLDAASHGAFTYVVLGALRGWADGSVDGVRDGTVTSEEASTYVRKALRELGVVDQRPAWVGGSVPLVRGGKLENTPVLPRVGSTPTPAAPEVPEPVVKVHGTTGQALSDFDKQLVEQQCVSAALELGPSLADAEVDAQVGAAAGAMSARWAELSKRRTACLGLGSVELRGPCIAQVETFLRDAAALVVERSPGSKVVPVRLATSAVGEPVDCGTRRVAVPGTRVPVTVAEVADAERFLAELRVPPAAPAPKAAPVAAPAPSLDLTTTLAAAGAWMQGRSLDEEPASFRGYFLVTEGDSWHAGGTIVTGAEWDHTSAPRWQTVYGAGHESGLWYNDVGTMAYLGPTWSDAYVALHDAFGRARGAADTSRFTSWCDRRVAGASAPCTASRPASSAPAPAVVAPASSGFDLDAVAAAAGAWALGSDAASKADGFFLVTRADPWLPAGVIVRGTGSASGSPMFRTVYGPAKDDGAWYREVGTTSYLGPAWDDRFAALSDAWRRRHGEADRDNFEGWCDVRRTGTGTPCTLPWPSSAGVASPTPSSAGAALDLDAVRAAAGDWFGGATGSAPAVFSGYFLVTTTDSWLAGGAVVRGSSWDGSSSPKFQTVYGPAYGDGNWYRDATVMSYLGPTWNDGFATLSDAWVRRHGAPPAERFTARCDARRNGAERPCREP